MRPALLIVAVVAAYIFHQEAMYRAELRAIDAATEAYKQGRKDALSLKEPISDDLEIACLTLWVSEQHKKYAEKNPTSRVGPSPPKETKI